MEYLSPTDAHYITSLLETPVNSNNAQGGPIFLFSEENLKFLSDSSLKSFDVRKLPEVKVVDLSLHDPPKHIGCYIGFARLAKRTTPLYVLMSRYDPYRKRMGQIADLFIETEALVGGEDLEAQCARLGRAIPQGEKTALFRAFLRIYVEFHEFLLSFENLVRQSIDFNEIRKVPFKNPAHKTLWVALRNFWAANCSVELMAPDFAAVIGREMATTAYVELNRPKATDILPDLELPEPPGSLREELGPALWLPPESKTLPDPSGPSARQYLLLRQIEAKKREFVMKLVQVETLNRNACAHFIDRSPPGQKVIIDPQLRKVSLSCQPVHGERGKVFVFKLQVFLQRNSELRLNSLQFSDFLLILVDQVKIFSSPITVSSLSYVPNPDGSDPLLLKADPHNLPPPSEAVNVHNSATLCKTSEVIKGPFEVEIHRACTRSGFFTITLETT